MGRVRFKRYCNPTAFRVVPVEVYQELLDRFPDDCRDRGLDAAALVNDDASRKRLEAFFSAPGGDLSPDLLRAMNEIDDLSDDDGHQALVMTARLENISLPPQAETWDARRLAIYCWLHHPTIFRSGADQAVIRKQKVFHDFPATEARALAMPSQTDCDAIAASLKPTFILRLLGESSEVRAYEDDGSVNFIVSHGQPYRADESLEGIRPSIVAYRPRKHDHVTFDNRTCRLRVSSGDAHLVEAYRSHFGSVLFGDPAWFKATAVVNLQPLKERGDEALAPYGQVLSARLVEIWLEHGQEARPTTTIYKGKDLFDEADTNAALLPQEGRPVYAVVELRFASGGRARRVHLEPPGRHRLPTVASCREDTLEFLEHHGLLAGPPDVVLAAQPPTRAPGAPDGEDDPKE